MKTKEGISTLIDFTGIIEFCDGMKLQHFRFEYYKNGELHRIDGPAVEWIDGDKHWYLNGLLHREDGPAIECAIGKKYWYLIGTLYTKEKCKIATRKLKGF
jgi:hypothetical protein